jgi:membrane protein YdbS with pleckstrin-like domain
MPTTSQAESHEVSPLAVKCGRFVLCLVGAILLAVAGWFAYTNPQSKIYLTSAVLLAGVVSVWLGVALPPKAAAHLGFWLPWLLPGR